MTKSRKIGKVGCDAMAKVLKVTREQVYSMKVIDSEDFDIEFDKIKHFFQEYENINQLNNAKT